MKRLYTLLLVIPLLFATGCKDDENPIVSATSAVEIVSADIEYSPEGGSGAIVTNASAPLTASSSVDWCTATVNGKIVNVSVAPYEGLENRYAKIELSAGMNTSYVTLHQAGNYLDLSAVGNSHHFGNTDAEVSYPVSYYNVPPICKTDVDWLSVEFKDGLLTIKAEDNPEGIMRSGNVSVGSKNIAVEQWDFEDIFAGQYVWMGYSSNTGGQILQQLVTIKDYDPAEEMCTIQFNNIGNIQMRIPFDPITKTFRIYGGQRVGSVTYQDKPAYIYSVVYTADNYVSWGAGRYVEYPMEYDEEEQTWVGALTDRGSYAGKEITSIYFELFSSTSPSSSTRLKVTYGKRMFYNIIVKL